VKPTAFVFVLLVCVPQGARCADGSLNKVQSSKVQSSAIASLPEVPSGLNKDFRIKRLPADRVQVSLDFSVTIPSFKTDTWIFAVPEPPELPSQDLLEIDVVPSAKTLTDRSPLRRSVRRVRIDVKDDAKSQAAGIECDFTFQLYRRSLVACGHQDVSDVPKSLADDKRRLFLRPTAACDYTAEPLKAWKDANGLIRSGDEGEIGFARRVFQTLVRQYRYRYVPNQDRTASSLCQTDWSDCGGMSTLLVSVLRSEGIPARILVGRWAKSVNASDTVDGQPYFQTHVIAEFYAQGVGWVPADLSSAVLHDKTDAKLKYFGNNPGNFIVLHVDPGVEFDTDLDGLYRAEYFQTPAFWVRGEGELGTPNIKRSWIVQPLKDMPVNP